MTTAEALGIVDKIGSCNIPTVCLTGGEPLCRSDLPVLLKAMSNNNIHVTRVCTNGFLLTDGILDMFEQNGKLPAFQISFDGVGCHDWMRGVQGAEEMAVRAMEVCRKRAAQVVLTMCLHKGNIHSLPDTVRLAACKGVKVLRIGFTEDIGGFSRENGAVPLTMDETCQVLSDYLPVFCRERPDIVLDALRIIEIKGNEPDKYTIVPLEHSCTDFEHNRFCGIAERSFYLTDEGRVLPCLELAGTDFEQVCLKLTEHSLEECLTGTAYDSFLNLDTSRLLRENPECGGCEHLSKCGCGCRGEALANRRGLYGTDQKRCDFFRHGWEQRIRQVIDGCLKAAD